MNHEHSRRSSAVPFGAPDSIPNAPPLPVPKPLQRARDAATRFFGYQSRPVSPQGGLEDENSMNGGRTRYASLSATQNATASHRTGLEINTISINEKGTHALIGGKEIFKTIKVDDGICAEDLNLRSVIRSNPVQASGKARQVYSIDIADVAWAKGDCGNYVAAATSSGKIILYDLGHAGLQAAQLHEHFRQVHNVTFNPHRGSLLLSGSQDGTVRLWDVRDVRLASTLQSKRKYSGQSDGVRDVKWSPTEGVDFAFGTDSGWIQKWDMRNLKTAKVKIPAHSETCNTIDWHPDGKHIVSASSDKTLRVWDFSTTRRQKASWEIKTPHPVLNARWRPACESSMPTDNGAKQCTQLITAYDQQHPVLHIWDLRRPTLPFREMAPYSSAPTDLLWHSQDLLWTVGREGVFLQADIQHAPKVIEKRNLQAFAVSPRGDINFVTQKRRQHHATKRREPPFLKRGSSSLGQSPDNDFLNRSWADDSLDQSFLRVLQIKRGASSNSTSRALSISSATDLHDRKQAPMLKLDDILLNRKSFKPHQVACRGGLPSNRDVRIFSYLARRYKIDVKSILKHDEFLKCFEELMEHNLNCAESVGLYRLSQTWKIVGFTAMNHFKERAEMRRKERKGSYPLIGTPSNKGTFAMIAKKIMSDNGKSPAPTPLSMKPVSSITQQLGETEITSDQHTPLARPTKNGTLNDQPDHNNLPDLDTDDSLALPPSVSPTTKSHNNSSPPAQRRLTSTNLDGLERLHQITIGVDKAAMVRQWSRLPNGPVHVNVVHSDYVISPPKLEKHDSNESFTFLDDSFDSRDPSLPASFASAGSGPLQIVEERPSKADRAANAADQAAATKALDQNDTLSKRLAFPIPNPENPSGRSSQETTPADIAAALYRSSELEIKTSGNADHDLGVGSYPVEWGICPIVEPVSAKTRANGPTAHGPQVLSWRSPISKTDVKVNGAHTSAVMAAPETHGKDGEISLCSPEDDDVDLENGRSFRLGSMLRELVFYYASNADPQTTAHLLLLFGPLLPRTHDLSPHEATATLTAYMNCFTASGHTQEDIEAILDQYIERDLRSGLQPLQTEAVLCAYHDRLMANGLLNEAAILRKLSFPAYPAVYDQAQKDNYVHLNCGSCGNPITSPMESLRCENCSIKPANCSVCWCDDSPFDVSLSPVGSKLKLLSTCLLCNHSGHTSCLRIWFDDAGEGDGACPVKGCLCDCVAGTWRSAKAKMAEKRRRYYSHSRVRSDDWSAKESRAVERTRTVLGVKGREG